MVSDLVYLSNFFFLLFGIVYASLAYKDENAFVMEYSLTYNCFSFAEFSWEDVKADKHRENYLGHSLKAPVGRWQKGKNLSL